MNNSTFIDDVVKETSMTSHNNQHNKNIDRKRSSIAFSHVDERQDNAIIQDWLAEGLSDKLSKASTDMQENHIPHLLYRNTIEESKDALKEEVGLISGKHIVIMTYAYGGFVPSAFQKIDVYTPDKFTEWIIKNGKKDLLLQCFESLR
jgi:hypothetical protein